MSYLARLKAIIGENTLVGELTELTKGASVSSVSCRGGGFSWFEDEAAALEERAALAAECVPAVYLDAWASLQIQPPDSISEDEWQSAVNDAGLFLDGWGHVAAEFQWTARQLFDPPKDNAPAGLIWFLRGERIKALGPRFARTESGRTFNLEAGR